MKIPTFDQLATLYAQQSALRRVMQRRPPAPLPVLEQIAKAPDLPALEALLRAHESHGDRRTRERWARAAQARDRQLREPRSMNR